MELRIIQHAVHTNGCWTHETWWKMMIMIMIMIVIITRNVGQCPRWWPVATLPNIGGALCSTPQFGWRPLLECRAVTLPRSETRWHLQGCPKLTKRSQPLVGRSSPYCVEEIRLLNKFFFPIVDTCLSCEDIARQNCGMVPRCRLFGDFLRPVFSASCAQHVSDLHSKFALRPHHVWKYGRHPISDRWH